MTEQKDTFEDVHTSRSQRFFNIGGTLSLLLRTSEEIINLAADVENAVTSLYEEDYGSQYADAIEIIEDEISTELVQLSDILEALGRDGLNALKILKHVHNGTGKNLIVSTIESKIDKLFGSESGSSTLPILAADAQKASVLSPNQVEMFDNKLYYCQDCGVGYEAEWEARSCTCIWEDRRDACHRWDEKKWERQRRQTEIKEHLDKVWYKRSLQGYEISDGITAIQLAEIEEVEDAEVKAVDESMSIGVTD